MTGRAISRTGAGWLLGSAIMLAAMVAAIVLLTSSPPANAAAIYQAGGEFAELYGQQCAACHGDEGDGGVGGALTESSLDLPARIAIITEGSGGMPAYGPTLSATQIEGLANYLDDFSLVQIYADQCGPCHGSAGEGGIGPSLLTSVMSEADRYTIIADGFNAMPGYSLTLTPDELQGVTDFVASFASASDAGEVIWTTQCAPCHGTAGEGAVAASIKEATTTLEDVVLITTNGVAGMPAYGPTLSAAEIEAVSAYAQSLRTNPPDPNEPSEPPATNEAGAAGYAANCAACHAADGTGGAGPAVSGTSLSVAELVSVIADGTGGMGGYGTVLQADEIDAIAQFVADLGSAAPPIDDGGSAIALGAVVYGENCALCHGVDASGASARALKSSTMTAEQMESAIVDGFGGMSGFGDLVKGEDLAATVAYLQARVAAEGGDPAEPTDTTSAPEPTVPVDTTDSSGLVDAAGGLQTGAEVYIGRCASCHGANGEGGVGSSLTNTELDEDEIISRIYGGHEDGMPAFDGILDPGEVKNVARYVVDLEGDAADSGGGAGKVFGALVLAVILGGAFFLWRSGWMSRSARTRRARR